MYAVAYLVFLYLPVAVLPVFSFNDSQYVTFPLKGFTFKWYYALADNQGLLNGFWNSVKVAVSVSVLSTILGVFAAKAVTRYRMRGRGGLIGFIMVPLVIRRSSWASRCSSPSAWAAWVSRSSPSASATSLLCVPFSMLVLISRMEDSTRAWRKRRGTSERTRGARSGG